MCGSILDRIQVWFFDYKWTKASDVIVGGQTSCKIYTNENPLNKVTLRRNDALSSLNGERFLLRSEMYLRFSRQPDYSLSNQGTKYVKS